MEEPISFCTRGDQQSCFFPPSSSDRTIPFLDLGFFLIRRLTGGIGDKQQLICLRSERLYTIGRKREHCQIVFDHCCISRRHCQIFLDGSDGRLRLVDGFYRSRASDIGELRRMLQSDHQGLGLRVSLNGVFVNRRRLHSGAVAELSEEDEVAFGCGNLSMSTRCETMYGFVVERIILSDFTKTLGKCGRSITRADLLQNLCKNVLRSGDPISYLRFSLNCTVGKSKSVDGVGVSGSNASFPVMGSESSMPTTKITCYAENVTDGNNLAADDATNAETGPSSPVSMKISVKNDEFSHQERGLDSFSNGQTFFLNHLGSMSHEDISYQRNEVTLKELLHPVESLVQIFIATFTLDISWFLSYCQIPNNLPVTIACHSAENCWSASCHNRTSAPYSDYPNLLLVFPKFSDEMAFGNDRSKKGVACHHPKLLVFQREESVRVVVTSANLVSRQWNQITNTVWWQDFPRRDVPDYSSLFASVKDSTSDFAAQLSCFIASLITDVPSQAHWIKELTKYDFGGAAVHLIASIPGMHAPFTNHSGIDFFQSLEQIVLPNRRSSTILGSVQASVVGLRYRFCNASDSRGEQLKKLASFFGKFLENSSELVEVVLKRKHNIPADDNAISVLVTSFQENSNGESVQLGFLPRDVAKWAAPLGDAGFLNFSAFVYPKEALGAALDGNNTKVQCLLSIAQGPKFSEISRLIQPEHLPALCSFIASIQRCFGLWRLQEVMSQYKWPELFETDFVYASSSIGTSMDSQFLAEFSAAAGKKSFQLSESEESDPEWGCWSTAHELRSPSIRILFPTIDRVKSSIHGIQLSKCLLSFSENTWQRLRNTGIFHDAIPSPAYRIGYPMHVKVARRRFHSNKRGSPAFGWIYCGSHNFSPAAWGLVVQAPSKSRKVGSGSRLRICNYELGIVLIIPPPNTAKGPAQSFGDIDHISLPFAMPAPRYCGDDRPATSRAMWEAVADSREDQAIEEMGGEDDVVEEGTTEMSEYVAEENEDDKIYAEMLWSQVDLSDNS